MGWTSRACSEHTVRIRASACQPSTQAKWLLLHVMYVKPSLTQKKRVNSCITTNLTAVMISDRNNCPLIRNIYCEIKHNLGPCLGIFITMCCETKHWLWILSLHIKFRNVQKLFNNGEHPVHWFVNEMSSKENNRWW